MNDDKIIEMVLDIVSEVDYDIYKDTYVVETAEFSPEEVSDNIQALVNIVKKYL